MKKSLLVLALLSVVGSASAYKIRIENKSDYTLRAQLWFAAPDMCGEKQLKIAPNSTKTHQSDACCLTHIRIQTTEYNGKDESQKGNVGLSQDARGRSTGFDISCRDNTVRVYISNTGRITIEHV